HTHTHKHAYLPVSVRGWSQPGGRPPPDRRTGPEQRGLTCPASTSRVASMTPKWTWPAALLVLVVGVVTETESNEAVTVPDADRQEQSDARARSFVIGYEQDAFLKDGEPFQIMGGSLHYFRVPRVYWRDRLRKMRLAGLNTVSTYVEWSLHEPSPGRYDMVGEQNLMHFIQLAEEEGLLVNLRVGPYICAERDMGGLPPWLLAIKPDMKLRSRDPVYQHYVKRWLDVLMPLVRPRLYGNGGPVILVQVENEYGSYPACDRQHLTWLRDQFRAHVRDAAVLYTTDGAGDGYLKCGKIPGVYATVDFGASSDPVAAFATQRKVEPRGPLMNSEYYPGWLTHWNEKEQKVATADVVRNLRWFLENRANFNFYVFMGGTNFGFTAGANFGKDYSPQLTSYDYDAPLNEAGDPTPKYLAIRQAIAEFTGRTEGRAPTPARKLDYDIPILLERVADLQALAAGPALSSTFPADFEQLYQSHGYVLYETRVPANFVPKRGKKPLFLAPRIRDRGVVFLDQVRQGVLCRAKPQRTGLPLSGAAPGQLLSVLVENQGRINYGGRLNDTKGLGNATLDGLQLRGWSMTQLPLDNRTRIEALARRADRRLLRRLHANGANATASSPADPRRDVPGVYLGRFVLPPTGDLLPWEADADADGARRGVFDDRDEGPPLPDAFVDTTGWGKGVVFINGFNLGRYWPSAGPQVTLYLPGHLLLRHPAHNRLVVVETDRAPRIPTLQLVQQPVLNGAICAPSGGGTAVAPAGAPAAAAARHACC
ncbi:Beta-galactosidase, partial [Frankliniella fusca]